MAKSTYQRYLQSSEDFNKHRRSRVEAKFSAAGLSWQTGGYPMNADEDAAFNAGFQRGCHAAWQAACRGENVLERWDMADSTAAGNGEQAGWNAAAKALA